MTDKPILGVFRKKHSAEFKYKAEHYAQAYQEIIDQLQQQGVYVAILMMQNSYLGKGKFTRHWIQHKRSDGTYEFEERGPITVDVLYDKEHFDSDGQVLQINDQSLNDICWQKEKTYRVLGEFHPKTVVVDNLADLNKAIATMPGNKIALKELTGSSGEGVFVGLKSQIKADIKYPILVQEFIETASGVKGITNKRHDIRVILAGGKPIAATLRTPPKNGFKSNIGYGGENRLLNIADLPKDLLELCQQIDAKLKPYGRFRLYSLDFGHTANGWRLFEANGSPGAIAQSRGEPALTYQKELVKFLKQAVLTGQSLRREHE